jgi:hypothetical protein
LNTIHVYRSCLHEKQLLADESGSTDILGGIISYLYPNIDLINLKVPSQTKKLMYPFTIQIRRVTIDTPLTIEILQAYSLPRKDTENAIINLMAKYNYRLEFLG